MTLTMYIVSDYIGTKAQDEKRMKMVASAFQSLGCTTVIGSRNPNAHSEPHKLGCTGKNDVFVCIFGGFDIEVVSDHTGYKQSDWFRKTRLKKASLMYIYAGTSCIDVANTKSVPLCHDCKGNIKGLTSIKKPANFLKNHQIAWIQGRTDAQIDKKIREKKFEGAGLVLTTTKGSTSYETKENKYTIKHGYSTSEHFEGYMKVKYTVDKSKTPRYIIIDFSSEAPDYSSIPKFNLGDMRWANDTINTHEIPLMKFIAEADNNYAGDKNGQPMLKKNRKYYIHEVQLKRNFKHQKDKKSTPDEDESKLYDAIKDDHNYKIDIYNLGIRSGENITPETLQTCGKTLYDAIKDVLEKANYTFNIQYAQFRRDDRINFNRLEDTTNIKETFNEGYDGNIIGISNVKYSPTADLINNSITVYKSAHQNDDYSNYRYARKGNLKDILRYGEQTHIESLSENTGYVEASQRALENLNIYYKPDTTFTCTVTGLPNVRVGEYVATKTVNPILTNTYLVASRKISMKVNDAPRIKTEYGLGDVDNKLKVKNNLAKQRRELVKAKLDLNKPLEYVDKMTDEFIEVEDKVWVD